MRKLISVFVSIIILQIHVMAACAADMAYVESVDVSPDAVVIKTDQPVQYDSFATSEPPRIVLELLNTQTKSGEAIKMAGVGKYLKLVRAEQYQTSPLSITRVILQLAEKAAYNIIATNNSLAIMLKGAPAGDETAGSHSAAKASVSSEQKPQEKRNILNSLPKDPISLDYDATDIKDVLNMLGAKIGVNIVYADDVAGDLTLQLNKVPFNEAFNTILTIKGLAAHQMGANILRVTTAQTLTSEKTQSPQITKVFRLNYLKAAEAKTTVENVISAEGRNGKVNADTGNNMLIVTDIQSGIDSVAQLLDQLDKKPVQIMIETKIVEVNLNNGFSFGISWSAYGGDTSSIGGKSGTNFFGTGSTANQAAGATAANGVVIPYDGSQTVYTPLPNSAPNGGTGVSYPSSSSEVSVGSFRFGRITSNYFLDMTIAAAEQKGKAKVLSDPKVATLNNKEAKINITTQIPYITTETTNSNPPISNTKVHYIDTGITLQVTPQVNTDGRITLTVKPSVSQRAASIAPAAGGAPGVDTRSAETTVMTKDGETIAIGGLIYDSLSDTLYKVPLLGDIPILGWLFKKKVNARQRIELLIFVTPRIVEG